jgi:tRNA (mo5U34)-methyltransferase
MSRDLEALVRSNPVWYHTIELAPGVVTPGWFDLRPILDRVPWPDIEGKRCLDVGTYDGFLAFELERRGAREVVATDISDHTQWDWPMDVRAQGPANLARLAGPDKGLGFRIAKQALGSSVDKVELNVYDLDPSRVGTFDIVVCGSLMLHLRDPLRALARIRSVCGDQFLSTEAIDLLLSVLHPRRPVAAVNGMGSLVHWTITNATGHRQMVRASGFDIVSASKPYVVPYGEGHRVRGSGLKATMRDTLQRVVAGGLGVPHSAVLARAI